MITTGTDASRARLERNHEAFAAAVADVHTLLDAGSLVQAAVDVGVASNLATWMHPGLFASGELERHAAAIGRAAAGGDGGGAPRPRGAGVREVLHVFTRTLTVGGHTRMVWRWMGLDGGRRHSVAITRQGGRAVPSELVTAAEATGGRVHVLGRQRGTLLTWARDLHELATRADLVVLHVDPEDAIPAVAFGDRTGLPPVLYLNHADHLFWLGVGIADLVVNLRRSGHELSPARRGVPADRNVLIPIALGERTRTMSRAEAKRRLGLPPDTVLLSTIARAVKFEYRPFSDETYVDALIPVVRQHEQVRLVVVGPSQSGDFARAHDTTGGRITALGERTDNDVLYQAMDVCIDSYPQFSPTTLLEAGSYGVPGIALCPQLAAGAILCADAPGIDAGLVRGRTVADFQARLGELITDPGRRMELGDMTRADIERLHVGAAWVRQLEALYERAVSTPPLLEVPEIDDVAHLGDPDATIAMGNPPIDRRDLLAFHARLLPWRPRARAWIDAVRAGKRPSPTMLLSEWAMGTLRRRADRS